MYSGDDSLNCPVCIISVFISQGNNPLYKGATSTFTNITYKGN